MINDRNGQGMTDGVHVHLAGGHGVGGEVLGIKGEGIGSSERRKGIEVCVCGRGREEGKRCADVRREGERKGNEMVKGGERERVGKGRSKGEVELGILVLVACRWRFGRSWHESQVIYQTASLYCSALFSSSPNLILNIMHIILSSSYTAGVCTHSNVYIKSVYMIRYA